MGRKEDVAQLAQNLMKNQKNIRNLGIVAHIDHGKTTTSDSLVAAAGLMSEELAGQQLVMDFYELEQERGITINASNISLVYKNEIGEFLVNLIDTPGHVDFGGEVIRAMRAVDGVIVVVDAVEGVMPQTETVVRQALREKCKPTLFINKVDRLVNELKVGEKEMQERLVKVIARVNTLIKNNCPEEFKDQWVCKVEDGSVCFGSALGKWGVSTTQMKKSGVTFGDVYKHCKEGTQNELSKKAPLYKALMDMIIIHLPNPVQAQKYRISHIWKGDMESEMGQSMQNCDPNGKISMMVTDVSVDPHAGEIATGRIYSGTARKGMKVRLNAGKKDIILQQVGIFMGPERVVLDEIPAGSLASLTGAKDVYVGETISGDPMQEFESFKTVSIPVITISIEAKHPKELPKLIEVIRQIMKEDPNVRAEINQETGEHLISGMGELHLEVTRYRIEHDHKMEITVSDPIVVYRETTTKESPVLLGKSPNKHNHLFMKAETLSPEVITKLVDSGLTGKIREKDDKAVVTLREIGFGHEESKRVWAVHNNCVLINDTRGIQALHEIRELVIQGFMDACDEGPLAKEKCFGFVIRLDDARLHEDAIHRGPSQILPTMTRTIYACMLAANAILLEPKQKLFISVPQDNMGSASKELQQRRAQIQEMNTEGDSTVIIALAPVKEMIGFSGAIRSATQGRAIWTAEFHGYEPLPRELQKNVIKEVRKRKGMDEEPKTAEFFLE
ncbi:MAG: elongation factor EF-2 [Candidatus Diapherotrites archaeon]|nr:elongation factor EF-2 [Candidatus Diapherotrites archaeon]